MGHKSEKKKTKRNFFVLDSWLPSIPKWSPVKAFSPVILFLLTLKTQSLVWNS